MTRTSRATVCPLTPPPSVVIRGTGHGGENIPTVDDEDDVEGHRVKQ